MRSRDTKLKAFREKRQQFVSKGHFRILVASVSKRGLVYNHEFDSQVHFQLKGFAPGLVLKQRQKATRTWPIDLYHRQVASFAQMQTYD